MYNLRHSTATLVWYLIIYVMLVSCGQKPAKISLAERKAMDSIVSSSRNIDTLSMIQKRMEREGNVLGSIVAYRAMGKELRNDSRFDEALKVKRCIARCHPNLIYESAHFWNGSGV